MLDFPRLVSHTISSPEVVTVGGSFSRLAIGGVKMLS
jgi:hypothetical protein